jgi:hypothetical protein
MIPENIHEALIQVAESKQDTLRSMLLSAEDKIGELQELSSGLAILCLLSWLGTLVVLAVHFAR